MYLQQLIFFIWLFLCFIFSLILCSVISLLSEVPDYNKIIGLTFGTLTENKNLAEQTYGNIDIILSAILIVVVIIIS
ncbi:MAG: hypothetical protein CM15mP65_29050 [Crocinitomicaceae bacterium]|nr:MAG: hypothetical protein CM15mP65_29050 [Crocinitomicaceae bacterium]